MGLYRNYLSQARGFVFTSGPETIIDVNFPIIDGKLAIMNLLCKLDRKFTDIATVRGTGSVVMKLLSGTPESLDSDITVCFHSNSVLKGFVLDTQGVDTPDFTSVSFSDRSPVGMQLFFNDKLMEFESTTQQVDLVLSGLASNLTESLHKKSARNDPRVIALLSEQ